jgi:alcohol dehydrogenase (cytochrome c)
MRYALLLFAPFMLAAQVTPDAIAGSPNSEWLTYHGDYSARRHSPLKQITAVNAKSLVPKWVFHIEGAKKLEATPIVYQSLMYISNTNEMYALDARNGRKVWHYRASGAKGTRVNRGSAILGNKVYFATADCHLIALDRSTGNLIFDVEYASFDGGYTTSIAPLAIRNGILVGVAGGGSGQRGFVAALHPDTGLQKESPAPIPGEGSPPKWAELPRGQPGRTIRN